MAKSEIYRIVLIIICLIFTTQGAFSQNYFASTSKSQRLFVCMDDLASSTRNNLAKKGISSIQIIYQNFIDPDNDWELNETIFIAKINQLYPNSVQSGICIIDWEPAGLDTMSITSTKYVLLLKEMEKAVMLAQKTRPKVKWGFYGFPFREYLHFTPKWRQRCRSLIPLLKKCDIITPSLYSFVPDSIRGIDNRRYIDSNISMALEIGALINRPVYPFVWHRWHDSTKEFGLKPIPMAEFQKHVSYILSRNYNRRKVAGIIWWGAEKYFYNRKEPVLLKESSNFKTIELYQENTINNFSNALLKIFNKRKKING